MIFTENRAGRSMQSRNRKKRSRMTCLHSEKPANLALPVTAIPQWFRYEMFSSRNRESAVTTSRWWGDRMLMTVIITLFVIVGVAAFIAMPVMMVNNAESVGGKEPWKQKATRFANVNPKQYGLNGDGLRHESRHHNFAGKAISECSATNPLDGDGCCWHG